MSQEPHGDLVTRFPSADEGSATPPHPDTDPTDARSGERPLPHGLVEVSSGSQRYLQRIRAGRHRVFGDEPEAVGGGDAGPTPYDYLLAALGCCTSVTLRMYADRKEWPLEHVTVRLRHQKIHAKDCEDCTTDRGRVDQIEREIVITGPLDEAQRARLLEIADRCPVHRTLTSKIRIRSRLAEEK